MTSTCSRLTGLAAAVLFAATTPLLAQDDNEHSVHHPEAEAVEGAPAAAEASPPAGMMGRGMMEPGMMEPGEGERESMPEGMMPRGTMGPGMMHSMMEGMMRGMARDSRAASSRAWRLSTGWNRRWGRPRAWGQGG
jgi:hypothetical protein